MGLGKLSIGIIAVHFHVACSLLWTIIYKEIPCGLPLCKPVVWAWLLLYRLFSCPSRTFNGVKTRMSASYSFDARSCAPEFLFIWTVFEQFWSVNTKLVQSTEEQQDFVKELHLLKTDIFMEMVEAGSMPLRPGVRRLVGKIRFLWCFARRNLSSECVTCNPCQSLLLLLWINCIGMCQTFRGSLVKWCPSGCMQYFQWEGCIQNRGSPSGRRNCQSNESFCWRCCPKKETQSRYLQSCCGRVTSWSQEVRICHSLLLEHKPTSI